MIQSIGKEIELQCQYLSSPKLESVYFGGGTPSILNQEDLVYIFKKIHEKYLILDNAEISFECNPDDLNKEKLSILYSLGINRLSIGIQSFKDQDLTFMNRSHTAKEGLDSIQLAKKIGFTNISVDLMFSLPQQTLEDWERNLNIVFDLEVQHISAYNLTVEEKTKLAYLIKKEEIAGLDESLSLEYFKLLMSRCKEKGFIQYEISNFGKKGFFSKHNSSYWSGSEYLGIGPSAHSYNGKSRQWNMSSNNKYISNLSKNKIPYEIEYLTKSQRYNEYILTSLRTMWGADIYFIKNTFGEKYCSLMIKKIKKWMSSADIIKKGEKILLTEKGKFISDSIFSDLFYMP